MDTPFARCIAHVKGRYCTVFFGEMGAVKEGKKKFVVPGKGEGAVWRQQNAPAAFGSESKILHGKGLVLENGVHLNVGPSLRLLRGPVICETDPTLRFGKTGYTLSFCPVRVGV